MSRSILAALLILPLTLGQNPGVERDATLLRERAFGIARMRDRTPWVGATVRLVSQPFAGCQDRDVLEVVADERGQFVGQILVGRTYSAWASSVVDEDWRVSQVVDDVVPHLPVVLDEQAREARVKMRVRGLEPWSKPGPVRLWCSGAQDQRGALPFGVHEGIEVELPPMGTGERWVFLTAGNGLDLFGQAVDRDARGSVELLVPPPVQVAIDVLQPDRTPVVGARIHVRSPAGTSLPGRTDHSGRLLATIPKPAASGDESKRYLPLWAEAGNHMTGRLWVGSATPAGPWTIFLQPTTPSTCRLLWTEGQPIVRAPVWITGVEQSIEPMQAKDGEVRGRPNGQFATDGYKSTGDSGELELAYDPAYPISIGVLLPAERVQELGARFGAALSPLALIWAGDAKAKGPAVARVDQLRPVRFVVRHHDGSPGQRAQVRLGAGVSPGIGLGYVADQAGRVTILLPVCDDIMLAAWRGAEGEVFQVAVPPGTGTAVAEVVLELPESVILRGRVYDRDGKAAAGVRVFLTHSMRGPHGEWSSSPVAGNASSPRIVARGYHYPAMAVAMYRRSIATDEHGAFRFDLPSFVFPLRVYLEGQNGTDLVDALREEPGVVEVDLRQR